MPNKQEQIKLTGLNKVLIRATSLLSPRATTLKENILLLVTNTPSGTGFDQYHKYDYSQGNVTYLS